METSTTTPLPLGFRERWLTTAQSPEPEKQVSMSDDELREHLAETARKLVKEKR